MTHRSRALLFVLALLAPLVGAAAPRACLSDCTPRIGVVSAFGAEAAILIRATRGARTWTINGNRFTTGTLRGNRVVIVLSGVSMINAAMTTQTLIDHFRIERLIMSGISGGIDPAHHVGDVIVPETWVMPMEVYWHHDSSLPAPCGAPGDLSCLGLRIAKVDGKMVAPFTLPGGAATGLFMRENHATRPGGAAEGEYVFDYRVDPAMLAVARKIAPALARCGPKAASAAGAAPDPKLCVGTQPRIVVGGRGVSGTAFLANPAYRSYLFEQIGAQTVDMETASLAHVAFVNGIPYIAFRSLSDLAGAQEFNADVGALFASGLAESNESAVTLAFLDAWSKQRRRGAVR
ncbi:MAG TPA: 5'-methylthioadenosine/S-adenosylhomocysteine nucleosidase [Caldimonas sp.]|nr:5'-methylthioadenosine/S-adenosylhomocysteine nucleosidase [Caldimonas sp.]